MALPTTAADSPAAPSAPLRVLLWSVNGAGRHYGGPGTSAWRLYSKATPGRFRITLAHGFARQEDYPAFAEHHLVAPYNTRLPTQLAFARAARRWAAAHWREFDVMHALQGFEPTMAAAYEAQRRGLPAVIKLAAHNSDFADKRNWRSWLGVQRRRRRRAMTLAGLIAISREIERELLGYGFPPAKIARIPNGVDTDQFHPADPARRRERRAARGWPDRPTLAFVGTLVPRKRPHLLIEALADLTRRGVEAQLVLVGPETDPVYVADMKRRTAELGLTDRVTWAGFTTDMAGVYQAADAFALPSSNEGMANAELEASASGIPTVATPTSGMADLIDEGVTGRIVPPDAPAIAEALAGILGDPATAARMGAAARARILAQYSAAAVLDKHERLFRRLMAGGPAAE